MKKYSILRIILPIISLLVIGILDYFDITQYIDCLSHVDEAISNTVTFISILIGFISCIYVMILQKSNSHILNLLRRKNLINFFNISFRNLMYIGFINTFILILMNLVEANFTIFKTIVYIAVPLSTYFFISSANIIIIICNMILAEESYESRVKVINENDIKL